MAYVDTNGTIVRVNDIATGALESLSGLKKKRPLKEYKSINTDRVILALGTASVEPFTISFIYDPEDTEGVKEFEKAFNDAAEVKFEIELPNKKTDDGNGTKYTWDKTVISDFEINPEEDGKYLATTTVAVNGLPTVTAAA